MSRMLFTGVLLSVGISYLPALGNHLVADSWVFVFASEQADLTCHSLPEQAC